MPNHRDTGIDDCARDWGLLGRALKLHTVHSGLFDMPPGIANRFGRIGLVRHKRHIAYQQRALGGAPHRLGMVNHLVHRHWGSAGVAEHHRAQRIAHQNDINARIINQARNWHIVGGEHGEFLLALTGL
jgi:hypothetical protein